MVYFDFVKIKLSLPKQYNSLFQNDGSCLISRVYELDLRYTGSLMWNLRLCAFKIVSSKLRARDPLGQSMNFRVGSVHFLKLLYFAMS